MDDFLSKPFQPSHLYAKISTVLGKRVASPMAPSDAVANVPDNAGPALLIDFSALAANLSHDHGKVQRFAQLFVRTTRDALDQTADALAEENMVQLSACGHRMKSSARAVGANRFADLCQHLEKLKRRDDLEAAQLLVAELESMFILIRQQIQASLGQVVD